MKKTYNLILIIFWLVLIFIFSGEASDVSSSQSGMIVDVISQNISILPKEAITFVVRKLAHIFLYFVLSILIYNFIKDSTKSTTKSLFITATITLLLASLDEIHQTFISGRSGQITDVIIDMIGCLAGLALCIVASQTNLHKQKIGKIELHELPNYLINAFLIILYILASFNLISTKMIPLKYSISITAVGLLTVSIITFFNIRNKFKNNKNNLITSSASLLLILGLIFISSICNSIYVFLDNINKNEYYYENYSVISIKSRDIKMDQNNKSIGLIENDNKSEILKIINKKSTAKNSSCENLIICTKYLDDQNVDTLVLKNAQLELVKENYQDFYKKIEIIYKFNIKVKNQTKDKSTDTSKPFTIYISGIDSYGDISGVARSDVNILVVVNPEKNKILLVNTPRDYYVQLHGTNGTRDKLTHAGVYGIEKSITTLEDLYETEINYYIRINFTSLLNIINTIGGIEVYSDNSFRAANYSFSEGYNQLNAEQALEFSRERYNLKEGDNARGRNQQRVIEAIIAKAQNNPTELLNYQNILQLLGKSIQTNMDKNEISELLSEQMNTLKKWQTESIAVIGTGKMAPTYSMGSMPLYVTEPDKESVLSTKNAIQLFKK